MIIWPDTVLLLGPSSVGKSTYLAAQIAAGRIVADQVHFAYEFRSEQPPELGSRSVIHYNMFDPFGNDADQIGNSISQSPPLRRIVEQGRPAKAIVCVAPKRLLAKRILGRVGLEPQLRGTFQGYPAKVHFEFINRVDLAALYVRWVDVLAQAGVPVTFISTADRDYRVLPDLAHALAVLGDETPLSYSEQERAEALANFSFPYHRVPGFDVTRDNADRSGTLDAIRPHLVRGNVLDVGCGLGAFCFALEREGFAPVLGTELNRDRFLAACVMREVSGSMCRFEFRDLLTAPAEREPFDNVLMLNVIHHLRDPLVALKRAASLARRILVLEYPTLADPKFRATIGGGHVDPELPLIGVSLLAGQDQTFLFSDAALERILVDNGRLFTSIHFLQSPMDASRRIAICRH